MNRPTIAPRVARLLLEMRADEARDLERGIRRSELVSEVQKWVTRNNRRSLASGYVRVLVRRLEATGHGRQEGKYIVIVDWSDIEFNAAFPDDWKAEVTA
jgi:hypothetical protein